MKRSILSLLFVMLIAFALVGCKDKTTTTKTNGNTSSTVVSTTTKPGTQVTSVPQNAVFEYFEWSADYSSCNAVFESNGSTIKLEVVVTTNTTENPSCNKEGTLVVTVTYGEHTETKTVSIPKLAHQPGEPVKENIVTKDNGDIEYDLVVYCLICHGEISRVHKIEKAGSENIDTPWIEG